MNQTVPVSQIVQINTHNPPEFVEHRLKDSPYTSSYASKGKRKKSKDHGSKDSLRKSMHKKDSKGMFRRRKLSNNRLSIEESKYSKLSEFQRMNMTLTQKIKVKAISQNNRKKIRKHNWNTIDDENSVIDNIMKFSAPVKKCSIIYPLES